MLCAGSCRDAHFALAQLGALEIALPFQRASLCNSNRDKQCLPVRGCNTDAAGVANSIKIGQRI